MLGKTLKWEILKNSLGRVRVAKKKFGSGRVAGYSSKPVCDQHSKAKLHEYLKLWKTPPPCPLPRSTLKTSWQLPSSPRPRDIKSGGRGVVEEEERKLWEVEVSGSFNLLLVSRTTASWTLLSGPSTHLIWTDHFFEWFVLWSFLFALRRS